MKGKIINYMSRRNLFKFGATAVGAGLVATKLEIIKNGNLKIIGGFYDLDTGIVTQVA